MRTLVTIACLLSSPAYAGEARTSPRTEAERSLTKDHLEHYAAPYLPEIRACYFQHGRPARRATGELALRVVVNRAGEVHEVTIDAPGVAGANLRELRKCVQQTVGTWHFPPRRDFTTAIIPYYFMYLDLPGAGPQLSCWNPKGCPDRPVVSRRR